MLRCQLEPGWLVTKREQRTSPSDWLINGSRVC